MKKFPSLAEWPRATGTRKVLVALLAGLALIGSGRAGSLDLGTPTSHTPYDQYLGPMWDVLHRLGSAQPDPREVDKLVQEGRAFRYVYKSTQPYVPQTPEETEATKSGDCKAKALWLAAKMDTRNVRFVVGKASLERSASHAWLIWEGPEGWLILDATMLSHPLPPDRTAPTDYVPIYSYSSSGKYAHSMVTSATKKYGDHL